jgi:hypothetical protein
MFGSYRINVRAAGRLVSPAKSRAQTVMVSRCRKRGAGSQLRVSVEHGAGAVSVRKRRRYEGTPRRESRSMMFIRLCESSQTRIRTYTRRPLKRTARILIDGLWLIAGGGVVVVVAVVVVVVTVAF